MAANIDHYHSRGSNQTSSVVNRGIRLAQAPRVIERVTSLERDISRAARVLANVSGDVEVRREAAKSLITMSRDYNTLIQARRNLVRLITKAITPQTAEQKGLKLQVASDSPVIIKSLQIIREARDAITSRSGTTRETTERRLPRRVAAAFKSNLHGIQKAIQDRFRLKRTFRKGQPGNWIVPIGDGSSAGY